MAAILQIVSPDELADRERAEQDEYAARQAAQRKTDQFDTELSSYIRGQWEIARNHRSSSGLENKLLDAMRMIRGEYDPTTLAEINEYGGSTVYARIVAAKARAATALLRDVFFADDRPWDLKPTPNPTLPEDMTAGIEQAIVTMVGQYMRQGIQLADDQIDAMRDMLNRQAKDAELVKARDEAERGADLLEDFLVEGGFYNALVDILTDLPIYPFVCLKGPFVRSVPVLKWENKQPVQKIMPKMFWARISPFDVYFTPGVSDVSEGDVLEHLRWTRKDLHDLLDLPGWDQKAVKAALEEYDHGLRDWLAPSDSQRAVEEGREDPNFNRSNMIDALEFHGSVNGKLLRDWGMEIEDTARDYHVQAWVCGRYVLKVHMSPSPRKRHPYFVSSFDKLPGTPVGQALPDILADVQQVANATLRSLVNNMSIASGPQVTIMDNRMANLEDTDELYPWKRWHMMDEPGTHALPPISFFQPQSNANELLGVYKAMTEIADELSALPRYITGSGASGGAGRTASGLSMLLGNANKVLHNVVANVDQDIIHESLRSLFDLVMLTGAGDTPLRGDEVIRTRGVASAMAREAERARQLEFLSITANPIDMQITGVEGRAAVLREVSKGTGLPGETIVPTREQMEERRQQALRAATANAAAEAQGDQPPAPADSTSPHTNLVQPGGGGMGGG